MSDDDELTTVASFPTTAEAEMARAQLEASGIVAHVGDAMMTTLVSHFGTALGGARVQVAARDAEEAREVLGMSATASHPFRSQHEGAEPDDETAADARARELAATASRAFRASVVGLFLCPGPLHLYSAWLLWGLRAQADLLPVAKRRQVTIAWAMNALVVAGALFAALEGFR